MLKESFRHQSHPFGDLIRQHLSRKHGLSQNKLADGIDQEPAIITAMCQGRRLTGPQARERVVNIIDWFYHQGVLTTVGEANSLLEMAGMAALNTNYPYESELLNQLTPPPRPIPPYPNVTTRQAEVNLIAGKEAEASAKQLGDIALTHNDTEALRALWRAICQTNHLAVIVDHCVYTIGRVIWETPDQTLEDVGFDIINQSLETNAGLIIDKFAYIIGEIILRTTKDKTRRRAWQFVIDQAANTNTVVRDKYIYTKNRIVQ